MMNTRLLAALAAYAVFALLAAFTLDGKARLMVWIVMAALALKSYLSTLQK
jgi:hypothetical protein